MIIYNRLFEKQYLHFIYTDRFVRGLYSVKHCGYPPVIENGEIDINRSVNFFLTELMYTCNPGYDLADNVITVKTVCQQNNSWTWTPPSCFGKYCFRCKCGSHLYCK